jgi:hypothetical protein
MKPITTSKGPRIEIQPGDSPWSITRTYVGDPLRWRELIIANPEKATTSSGAFVSLVPGETLAVPVSWVEYRQVHPFPPSTSAHDAAAIPSHDAGAFPHGWNQEGITTVKALAEAWNVSTDDLMVTWFAESGLQPHIVTPAGNLVYAGLIEGESSIIDSMLGSAKGTWLEIVKNQSVTTQLQAIAQVWDKIFKSFLPTGKTVGMFANEMGVSAAAVIHALNFLPARVRGLKNKFSPLTKSTDKGDPGTRTGSFYGDNAGLDLDQDGAITLADLDTQASTLLRKLEHAPEGAVAQAARSAPEEGLASVFAPITSTWEKLTGKAPITTVGYGTSSSGGWGGVFLLGLLFGGAWLLRKKGLV